jgi:copper(I)-binding protein
MTIKATKDVTLVRAESTLGKVELHETRMEGDVMKMRPVQDIAVHAGKSVQLKPGGLHIMIVGLKAPIAAEQAVPLTLVFMHADKHEEKVTVNAVARTATAH